MNIKIGTFLGVPLYLNCFTVLCGLFILATTDAFYLSLFIWSIFFIVLHEYGHCWMAKRYNWLVLDVHIYPIGGVARIDFQHHTPMQEFMVTIAGPAVNFIFMILFSILMMLAFYVMDNMVLFLMFMMMFVLNLFLILFNILPVFPLDGGRLLRAILSIKLGHEKATWWAVRVGQIGAILLIIVCATLKMWVPVFVFCLAIVIAQEELSCVVQGRAK